MAIRAHNWYTKNSTRRYPLDDFATGETDSGIDFPNDILVDCHLRFPESAGNYAFISSVHTSATLISITFATTNSSQLDADAGISSMSYPSALMFESFQPLAVVNVLKDDVVPGQQYPVDVQIAGAGGWVVFGTCIEGGNFQGTFSTINQSKIAPRCARAYEALPIPNVGKLTLNTALDNIVNIAQGPDLEIIKAKRTIEGAVKDAIVFRLTGNTDHRNLLNEYKGPCGGRPETDTCNFPGIESIAAITPDCNGNITISYLNCIEEGPITSVVDPPAAGSAGANLDFCLPLTCVQRALTVLYDCEGNPIISGNIQEGWTSEQAPPVPANIDYTYEIVPSIPPPTVSLPFSQSTNINHPSPGTWKYMNTRSGAWEGIEYHSDGFHSDSYYYATDELARNVQTLDITGYTHVRNRTFEITALLQYAAGVPNIGGVFGFKHIDATQTYYVAELNKTTDTFRVVYYSGSTEFEVARSATPLSINYNVVYTIQVVTVDNTVDVSLAADETECTCSLFQAGHTTAISIITFTSKRLHATYTRFGTASNESNGLVHRISVI